VRNSRPTATAYTREVLNLNLCSAKQTGLAEVCVSKQCSRKVLMGTEPAVDQREMQDKLVLCVQGSYRQAEHMQVTDSFGETRFVPHVPSSSWLESVIIIIVIVVIITCR